MAYTWTPDKVRALSTKDVRNLLENARRAENADLIRHCESALAQRGQGDDAGAAAPRVNAATFTIPATAVADAATLISALPPVDELANGIERRRLQARPITTLGELWRLFITCGFSSVENSEEGSPLDRFIKAQGPLFDLAYVRKMSCDPDWVVSEIRTHVPRMADNKRRLVLGSFAQFEMAAAAPTMALADLCRDGESLSVFCRLARGEISDGDLAGSAAFSGSLDPTPFPRIGNKQLRNILVNSGLARNVVPLDSRWQRFFGSALPVTSQILADKARYLAIEDVLRQALLANSAARPDIDNLAVLDAVVFQSMSKNGMTNGGWAGAGVADAEFAEIDSPDDSLLMFE